MKRPNVILIMTDDQGYGDLSCMGSRDVQTPCIDALAASGARFTDWYSNSPVCSPSRAALLTGRYPGNAGVRAILAGHRRASGLSPRVPTIAGALKELGYRTGLVGKWHLGTVPQSRPNRQGFDYFYGFLAGCIDYYSHIFYWGMADGRTDPVHDLWEGDREIRDDGRYFTDLVTENAVKYVRQAAGEGPFLLYVAYNAPHYPMHAPQKYLDRFSRLPRDRQVMAAMISAVDDGVGDLMEELRRSGALDNTLVFFQSDNGPSRETRNWLDGTPDPYYGGATGGLRGHKFSLFEGGLRVPGIFRWPAGIPGGQVIHEPCAAMDVFPTVLKAAGGDPARYELDGRDILGVLRDGARSPHDAIYWEMDGQTAVRRGRYKLVLDGRLVEHEGPVAPVFLADLASDPGETVNLAGGMPELAGTMSRDAKAWREGIERRWRSEWEGGGGNLA